MKYLDFIEDKEDKQLFGTLLKFYLGSSTEKRSLSDNERRKTLIRMTGTKKV